MLLSDDQLHELYEINDDPKRKEFLDDLFSFMQKRGTPINRLPIMAKSVLDLYELYNLVIARGGLVDVINKKLWQEIIKGLHLPSSITSAAFTLRTQYMKYLYPYECEKKNLSTPSELQAAIDGNRREGRRSSYGQFEAMHSQLQLPPMPRPNVGSGIQQMSPLALVTHASQQQAAAAAAAAAHHRLMAPPLGQMPNIVTHELEQRMMEYLKLFQQKEARRSQSPEITPREALNALEMSRVALWNMYHNNTSPPSSVNASPVEPQREALNLSDSPPNIPMKRERESSVPPHSDDFNQQPPLKKSISSSLHDLSLHSSSQQNLLQQQQLQQQQQHQQQIQQLKQNNDVDDDHQRNKNRENRNQDNFNEDNEMKHLDMTNNGIDDNQGIDEDEEEEEDEEDIVASIKAHHKNMMEMNLNKERDLAANLNGALRHLNGHGNSMRKSPSSSPIKLMHNGHNHPQQNDEFSIMSGMQFKITKKGNGPNGEQQLVVNLDLNGVHYEGILFSNPTSPKSMLQQIPTTLQTPPTPTSNSGTSGGTISPKIAANTLVPSILRTRTPTNSTLLTSSPKPPSTFSLNNALELRTLSPSNMKQQQNQEKNNSSTSDETLNGEDSNDSSSSSNDACSVVNDSLNGDEIQNNKESSSTIAQTTSQLEERLHAITTSN